MAQPAGRNAFTFPNQQTIITYFDTHPTRSFVDAPILKKNFPDSIEKVSQYFSGKIVEKEKVDSELRNVLIHQKLPELVSLKKSLEALTIGDKPNILEREWKFPDLKHSYELVVEDEEDCANWTDIIVKIYSTLLIDQQENAFYTPPPDGEKAYVRHVRPL